MVGVRGEAVEDVVLGELPAALRAILDGRVDLEVGVEDLEELLAQQQLLLHAVAHGPRLPKGGVRSEAQGGPRAPPRLAIPLAGGRPRLPRRDAAIRARVAATPRSADAQEAEIRGQARGLLLLRATHARVVRVVVVVIPPEAEHDAHARPLPPVVWRRRQLVAPRRSRRARARAREGPQRDAVPEARRARVALRPGVARRAVGRAARPPSARHAEAEADPRSQSDLEEVALRQRGPQPVPPATTAVLNWRVGGGRGGPREGVQHARGQARRRLPLSRGLARRPLLLIVLVDDHGLINNVNHDIIELLRLLRRL
mmetsp:Transcript_23221/g.72511  ORF Transcript_23221/g.72511 Transcript_23221/m.72511 type:complete len:314 (-) Transcript_23221:3904-4845(-)